MADSQKAHWQALAERLAAASITPSPKELNGTPLLTDDVAAAPWSWSNVADVDVVPSSGALAPNANDQGRSGDVRVTASWCAVLLHVLANRNDVTDGPVTLLLRVQAPGTAAFPILIKAQHFATLSVQELLAQVQSQITDGKANADALGNDASVQGVFPAAYDYGAPPLAHTTFRLFQLQFFRYLCIEVSVSGHM